MGRVARIGIVRDSCPCQGKWPVRQMREIVDAAVEIGQLSRLRSSGRSRGEQGQICSLQGRLNRPQERERRDGGEWRRFSGRGTRGEVQGRRRKRLVGNLLTVVQADEVLLAKWRDRLELRCLVERGAGRAVAVDDALRQEVLH